MTKGQRWYGVRLPEGLMGEVERIVEEKPLWSSKADFVKDAVRQLLNYYDELDTKKKKR